MRVQIEIRPGEGGEDARLPLLVQEQARIHLRYAERQGVAMDVAEATPS